MCKASLTSKTLIRKNLNNTGDKNYSYLFVIIRADIFSVCMCVLMFKQESFSYKLIVPGTSVG